MIAFDNSHDDLFDATNQMGRSHRLLQKSLSMSKKLSPCITLEYQTLFSGTIIYLFYLFIYLFVYFLMLAILQSNTYIYICAIQYSQDTGINIVRS